MCEHSVFFSVESLVLAHVNEKPKDNEDCVEKGKDKQVNLRIQFSEPEPKEQEKQKLQHNEGSIVENRHSVPKITCVHNLNYVSQQAKGQKYEEYPSQNILCVFHCMVVIVEEGTVVVEGSMFRGMSQNT